MAQELRKRLIDDDMYGEKHPYRHQQLCVMFDFGLLAKRLKNARKAAGLSTTDIGRLLLAASTPDHVIGVDGKRKRVRPRTVSASTIRRIENQSTEPTLETMVKLAGVFEAPVSAFFDETFDQQIGQRLPSIFEGMTLRAPMARVPTQKIRTIQTIINGFSSWIGGRIRRRREYLGLADLELALDANVSISTLNKIEDGERLPSWIVLDKIGSALKVDPLWLLNFY